MRLLPCLLLGCALPMVGQQAPPKEGTTMPFELTPLMPATATMEPNAVVLQVGEIKITAKQLDALIDVYPQSQQVFLRGPGREQFADTLIRMIVLSQEGRKRKLQDTDKFKEQMRFSETNLLANTLSEVLPKEIVVDELALRKYYEEHRCEYPTWKVRHIVVRFKGSPLPIRAGQADLTEDEALMRAKQLQQRGSNADFAFVAKLESDDPSTSVSGGDLGQFKRGQMLPAIEETVCRMKPGEISAPVKTPSGYHVLKLESKEEKEFAEMKGELEQKYRAEAAKKLIDEMIGRVKVVKDKEYYAPMEVKNLETKKP
jgi:parvulin-like peptidyl-prolyl isomerase